jgi:hypothetical protein
MDLERPKNKSSRNRTKPVPLHPTRHVDSGHIFFFANGPHMRKISRSGRFPKQAKSQIG